MRLLDLFCGAGGAAMGYSRAGFDEIVGIDIVPQKNYPFTFIQGDALEWTDFDGFDLVHASPPCQSYSVATPLANKSDHPDLVAATRQLLGSHPRSVIENVPSAPLRPDLILCGSMFGLQVQRHRIFELAGLFVWNPPACRHVWTEGKPWIVTGNGDGHRPSESRSERHQTHTKKYRDLAHARDLMGMPWARATSEVVEAIPPAYTEFLGRQFLDQLARSG